MEYEVVENPRRRRRKLSAKQIAAGFGGKRRMSGRRRRRRSRRNPGIATYRSGGRTRRAAVMNPRRRSRRRARRNPMLGGLTGMFDFPSLLQMTLGGIGVKIVPGLIKNKLWSGLPTDGLTGKLTQVGTAFLLSMLAKQFMGRRAAQNIFNGAVVVTLIELVSDYALPALGLSGYTYMTNREMAPFLRGYVGPGGNRLDRTVVRPVNYANRITSVV